MRSESETYWCDVTDYDGNFFKVNFPIHYGDTISNNFFRQCIFYKKALLFEGMTLICEYQVDSVTKKLSLCSINADEKYLELISDINMKFEIMHRSWGLI